MAARRGVATLATIPLLLFLTAGNCTNDPPPPPPGSGPPYPIVLAHGFLGMESYGPLDYWFGIVSALEDEGHQVFVTQVSAINDSYVRGAQLQSEVETIVATTGKAKVHLIGHSQGGLDVRYVAGTRPDLVASVTAIAGPHKGADLASFFVDGIQSDGSFGAALIAFFGGLLEDAVELLTGTDDPLDAEAAFSALLPGPALDQFNADFPDGLPSGCHPGASQVGDIHYYSWTGDRNLTNVLDVTDPIMGLTGLFYGFEQNDGLVTVCSAQFGDVIRDDYGMNHLDEVNQILGLVNLFETNPKTVFEQHATRLDALAP